MAQQLAEIVTTLEQVDALLVGAHALSMAEGLLPELRLAKVRLVIVDASLMLTAASATLRETANADPGRLTA